jgi:cysteinyl-tRNA synthetase
LGQEIDIHTGGEDLIFPHHENETAQSCCATGRDNFAHYWLHNGYITVEGEKMSKSQGNFYTVHDLLDDFPGEAIRLTLLSAQYRQPLDFSKDKIRTAKQTLDKWYLALSKVDSDPERVKQAFPETVWMALLDDLNTPQAIAHIHELVGQVNRARDDDQRADGHAKLLKAGQWMGILGQDPQTWLQSDHRTGDKGLSDEEIEKLVTERELARHEGRYNEADAIRDRLEKAGLIIEDSDGSTTWRRR